MSAPVSLYGIAMAKISCKTDTEGFRGFVAAEGITHFRLMGQSVREVVFRDRPSLVFNSTVLLYL